MPLSKAFSPTDSNTESYPKPLRDGNVTKKNPLQTVLHPQANGRLDHTLSRHTNVCPLSVPVQAVLSLAYTTGLNLSHCPEKKTASRGVAGISGG